MSVGQGGDRMDNGQPFLRRIHEPTKHFLPSALDVPAHLHHVAHRMANPPVDRPHSRREFLQILDCLDIPADQADVRERFGFGIKLSEHGDRLIIAWEAHTEYYSYQVWHIPADKTKPLTFGPITYPGYVFPICPLGIRVNSLDIVVRVEGSVTLEYLTPLLPGPHLYASRVFGEDITLATSFTPDDDTRERYHISSRSGEILKQYVAKLVDAIVAIENYYHLMMLPMPAFSRAVDQIHDYEQRHLYQRAVIMEQMGTATPASLQKWLNALTQDLLQVSRLAESMRYRLSGAFPYDKIVRGNLDALQEQPVPSIRPISEYICWRITGVADGYQQLLRRIDAMQADFEATVAVIRTQIELRLQEQNLAAQDQNLKLLASVDKTTRSQAILQHTVESLSVIVITYYLSGLGSYLFKGLHEVGWLSNATIASAIFVPIAFVVSFGLMLIGRKIIYKRMGSSVTHLERNS